MTTHDRTAELWARAVAAIPGGVNSATRSIGSPHIFTSASGAYVYDAAGQRYVDYHAAFGATLLGHADPRITEEVATTIERNDLVGLGVTELEIECAEKVNQLIPSAERTILTMSGTEATFQAVRLSRAVTNRELLIKFQGCFHGGHDAVARNVISPPELAYGLDPLSAGIQRASLDATLVAEFNDLASVEELFELHSGQIAALIVEPIPHNVGCLLPDSDFLKGIRDLTERHGAVLIFDEVITGFRHAPGGYQELCGVAPDLTTYGKAMGNGYPVAGMSGRAELMDRFNSAGGDVLLAGTFNGNPVSTAAALATLEIISRDDHFHRHVFDLGDRMRSGLQAIVDDLGIAAHVSGFGSVFVCYFLDREPRGFRDLLDNDDRAYREFHRRMTDRGFLMLPLALKRNHISGSHTAADIDRTLDAASDVLAGMKADGLLRT